jgi:hypothetical protein
MVSQFISRVLMWICKATPAKQTCSCLAFSSCRGYLPAMRNQRQGMQMMGEQLLNGGQHRGQQGAWFMIRT